MNWLERRRLKKKVDKAILDAIAKELPYTHAMMQREGLVCYGRCNKREFRIEDDFCFGPSAYIKGRYVRIPRSHYLWKGLQALHKGFRRRDKIEKELDLLDAQFEFCPDEKESLRKRIDELRAEYKKFAYTNDILDYYGWNYE